MKLRSAALAVLLSTTSSLAWSQENPADFRTAEYYGQWGLHLIYADYAYSMGVDGSGVTIGLIDTGLDVDHPELAGRYETGVDFGEVPWSTDNMGHGTAVAAVAVANRDGFGMHGVAPGARVVVAQQADREGVNQRALIDRGLNALIDQGVRVIVNSYGIVGFSVVEVSPSVYEAFSPDYIAATRRAVDSGALMIVATHNDYRSQPSPEAGLPYLFPELQPGWLAVTAVGPTGAMADYANRCGVAMNWCLAAPGGGDADEDLLGTAWPGGGYMWVNGTSFAAPHAAGAAALVWQMFPYLDAQQVGHVLLGTATDMGPVGVDEVSGYGLLNVGRAVLGPGRFDWGDFHVRQPDGVSYFFNNIAGDGGLIKSGQGLLVLAGFNTYAGGTRIKEGGLALDGFVGSPVRVDFMGSLLGEGVVIGDTDNAGVIVPGNVRQAGVFSILGDYRHRSTGVLVAAVSPEGATNALLVYGQATLDRGEVWAELGPGAYTHDLRSTILATGQGVSGRFANLVMEDYVFLKGELEHGPASVDLVIRRLPFDASSVAVTANQRAVGGEFERSLVGGDEDILSIAGVLQRAPTITVAQEALSSVSGDMHATLATIGRDGGAGLGRLLRGRLDDQLAENAEGAWVRPYGEWAELDGDGEASGATADSTGFLTGFDRQAGDDVRLGAAFGFDRTEVDFDQFGGKGQVETWQAAVYGRRQAGPLRLDGWLGYGRLDTSTDRDLVLGQASRHASAEYRGDRLTFGGEAGRRLDLGWGRIEPLAALRYTWLRQDAFSETDAGSIGLRAEKVTTESLASGLGVRAATSIALDEGRVLDFDAQARWEHEFLDQQASLNAGFLGVANGGFTARGVSVGRDSLVLGASAGGAVAKNTELRLGYDAALNADRRAQAVTLALRVAW